MTKKIKERSTAHEAQLRYQALPRAIMGGTVAMRAAGRDYLPQWAGEKDSAYEKRLEGAVLVNYLSRTIDYLAGQVFQKEVDFQSADKPGGRPYKEDFFNAFKEDVDLAGDSLNVFAQEIFQNGLVDGISFILVDYSRVNTRTDESGQLLYESGPGEWSPKTQASDRAMNLRPYFVQIKAGQVLDAWLSVENGRQVLKHFRYEEAAEVADDDKGLERQVVTRVRAWWPDKWEVYEVKGRGEPRLIDSGTNALGYIPIYWFRPGQDQGELAAISPLHDLAEMNRSHWVSYAQHVGLMSWVRSPVWMGRKLDDANGQPLAVGPSSIINVNDPEAGLESVGVDPSSVAASQEDLKRKEEYMEAYGLQVAFSPTNSVGQMTATQVDAAASASDSQLKSWCGLLRDCLENALKAAADYEGDPDGPSVFVNTAFRAVFDAALLSYSASQVDKGHRPLVQHYLLEKSMGLIYDDMSFEDYQKALDEAALKAPKPTMGGAFGAYQE